MALLIVGGLIASSGCGSTGGFAAGVGGALMVAGLVGGVFEATTGAASAVENVATLGAELEVGAVGELGVALGHTCGVAVVSADAGAG